MEKEGLVKATRRAVSRLVGRGRLATYSLELEYKDHWLGAESTPCSAVTLYYFLVLSLVDWWEWGRGIQGWAELRVFNHQRPLRIDFRSGVGDVGGYFNG